MGKPKSIVEQAKADVKLKQQAEKAKQKEESKMKNKPIIETIKTILITILITGIIAFIGGIHYEKQRSQEIQQQAKELTAIIVEPSSKQ